MSFVALLLVLIYGVLDFCLLHYVLHYHFYPIFYLITFRNRFRGNKFYIVLLNREGKKEFHLEICSFENSFEAEMAQLILFFKILDNTLLNANQAQLRHFQKCSYYIGGVYNMIEEALWQCSTDLSIIINNNRWRENPEWKSALEHVAALHSRP